MSRSLKPSPLARQGDVPLYRQIYEHFRRAIADGQLSSGDRLPSCRRLAEQFATARGTVDAAYAMLAGEGYVVSRGPAGTIVSPDLGARPFVKVTARRPLSAGPDTICQDCAQSTFGQGQKSWRSRTFGSWHRTQDYGQLRFAVGVTAKWVAIAST